MNISSALITLHERFLDYNFDCNRNKVGILKIESKNKNKIIDKLDLSDVYNILPFEHVYLENCKVRKLIFHKELSITLYRSVVYQTHGNIEYSYHLGNIISDVHYNSSIKSRQYMELVSL